MVTGARVWLLMALCGVLGLALARGALVAASFAVIAIVALDPARIARRVNRARDLEWWVGKR